MTMANYRPMLELADELALLQRYLGPQEEKKCGQLSGAGRAVPTA